MRILQINSTVNTGSTGRSAEELGRLALDKGYESYIAYGRGNRPSASKLIRIGNMKDVAMHGLKTRVFDRHGFGSKRATTELIKRIESVDPDVIGLHNLHGYYLNIEVLFDYLKASGKPAVWTLHDAWSFTGHCSNFDRLACRKWQELCGKCLMKRRYPASVVVDNSRRNFIEKKALFSGVRKLQLIVPSRWLAAHVRNSFLADYPLSVIHNGVNLGIFRPMDSAEDVALKFGTGSRKIVLGVSNIWSRSKGLSDFLLLSEKLGKQYVVVLVGLTRGQIKKLPSDIVGISRTENLTELAELYSAADVFVNPTYADNFPTTNIEALACGTPVVTYNTGGSPEAIDECTGITVEKGDTSALAAAVVKVCESDRDRYRVACRSRAEKYFDKDERFLDYLNLYLSLVQ